MYGECSDISIITFSFLLSNKMMVFMAGIHKMLVRIANWENPDHTARLVKFQPKGEIYPSLWLNSNPEGVI